MNDAGLRNNLSLLRPIRANRLRFANGALVITPLPPAVYTYCACRTVPPHTCTYIRA